MGLMPTEPPPLRVVAPVLHPHEPLQDGPGDLEVGAAAREAPGVGEVPADDPVVVLLQGEPRVRGPRPAAEPVHGPHVGGGHVLPPGEPVQQLDADEQVVGLVAFCSS